MSRRIPRGASRVAAWLLVSPRDFLTTFCEKCRTSLYYTYVGEECPHCGEVVTTAFAGRIPIADDRAAAHPPAA